MKHTLIILFGLLLSGCYKVVEQFDIFPNDPDIIDQVDTIPEPIDTIIIEPCTDSLYLEPAFVTGWWYIPEPITTDLTICAYPHCVTAPNDSNVVNIIDSLLSELYPSFVYSVYQNGSGKISFIAEGTNDINLFHGKVWIRMNDVGSGAGFAIQKQAYAFLGSVTFDEYMAIIDLYPSARYVSFRFFDWTAEQYIKAALKILECRDGRDIIDFRGIILDTGEPYAMPDSIVQMAIPKWNEVRT